MKLSDRDREQMLRNFLTEARGHLSQVVLNIDLLLDDKRYWKPTAPVQRKKKVNTK